MRTLIRLGLGLALVLAATPASAQVIHSFQIGGGWFFPRAYDARDPGDGPGRGDVLVRDLDGDVIDPFFSPPLTTALAFPEVENCFDRFSLSSDRPTCLNGFRTGQIFGEWNVAFGDRIEVGAGLGFQQKSVHSLYRDLQRDLGNGQFRDIEQDLKLRTFPITGVVRFMPFNRAGGFQPYVGAGVTAIVYRYSEIGEFVDTALYPDFIEIFDHRYIASGTAFGGLLLGGMRIPLGGDIYALTLEGRYQWATGKSDDFANEGFVGDKIDLGGGQFNIGFLIRF